MTMKARLDVGMVEAGAHMVKLGRVGQVGGKKMVSTKRDSFELGRVR